MFLLLFRFDLINDENSCSINQGDENDQNDDFNGEALRNCYCNKERNLEVVELQCAKCLRWCHEACITIKLDKVIQFMTSYTFFCKLCSSNRIESSVKRQTSKLQLVNVYFHNRFVFRLFTDLSNCACKFNAQIYQRKPNSIFKR